MPPPLSAVFTVMCYNVLCEKYATRQLYGYCPSWALSWSYRRKGIMEEITSCHADIISLQVSLHPPLNQPSPLRKPAFILTLTTTNPKPPVPEASPPEMFRKLLHLNCCRCFST